METTLKMASDFMPLIESGQKKITIRKGRRDIPLGEIEAEDANDPTKKCKIHVLRVEYCQLGDIRESDMQADGFKDIDEMYDGMKKFYPDLLGSSEMTIICFFPVS